MSKVKSLIGTRVKIEYHDQNDSFSSILPRLGTVARQVRAEQGVDDWFLVQLDEPFDYQIRSDPFYFTLLHCENLLIRSRWKGHHVGEAEPTSVFILLIKDEEQLKCEPIKVEGFYFVAWGMCCTEQANLVK